MHPNFLLGGLLALAALPAFAATTPDASSLTAPRVASDITVDGVLDEPVWAQATQVELPFEVQPGDNTAAAVRTVAHIAYTEDALLIGFRAEDPDPTKIVAFLRDRDALYQDDFVGIMLDTFDDQRRAYEFFVNPLGVQADLIREEATGNEDDSWDGLWTSAARITEAGYEAEIRIPFATLRFRNTDGERRWAASFFRIRPRDFRYQYASNRFERGARCMMCAFRKLDGFQGVKQGRNIEITPTLTVLHTQERESPDAPWQGDSTDFQPGLDVAWAPTPNLTVNGTLNPDFSQVESDQAQLDLNTSFALFFPEKRPFFLEGADYFNTPLQVLYTRQIADPDAGLRLTGRSGQQAYGVIAARDVPPKLLVPGVLRSNYLTLDEDMDVLVGRYRYDLNKSTTLGAIGTFRNGEDHHNGVAGVDARWQSGLHTVRAQWLHSDSRYPGTLDPSGDILTDTAPTGDALFAHYNIGKRNWYGNVQYMKVDPGFRADLGFITQVGYDKPVVGGGYMWFGKDGAKISKVTLEGDWDITHRYDGQLLERELEGYVRVNAARQTFANAGFVTRVRYWDGQMFDETFYTCYIETQLLPGLKVGSWQRIGDMLDLKASRMGRGVAWEPFVELDVGRGINVTLNHTHQRLKRDGGTAFDAKVIDGRLSWQLDPRQRLRLSVQASEVERNQALYTETVNEDARDLAAQLLYSYKVNPRTALYAGYSQGGYADDLQESFFNNTRSVFLKLSYAWQPQL